MAPYDSDLEAYVRSMFGPMDAALQATLEETPKKGLPAISVRPEEGRFLQFLVRALGVRRALEIGTLGGFSGTWIARGLLPGGQLITLEKEPRHAEVAREHFLRAEVLDRIEILIGDAHESLLHLKDKPPFDFIFIDAEKTGYPAYLDWALEHVRMGGVIAVHNAFRHGDILKTHGQDEATQVMQPFNRRFASEPRLLSTVFPGGDGILLGVRIEPDPATF